MTQTEVACDYGRLSEGNFQHIKTLLYNSAGIYIPDHKQQMVFNRIVKRIQEIGLTSFDHYITYVDRHDDEIMNLINALTTNVTHFYRENHHYDHLRNEVKHMIDNGQKRLRIWSAACSIGAEPYSAAMTISDVLPHQSGFDIKILATDIDTNALEVARKGVYVQRLLKGLPTECHKKYCDSVDGEAIKIKQKIRDMVFFNYMNFNTEIWPMSGPFDFIFCRNVLIYFDKIKQQEYIQKMLRLLKPGGFIYLGHSENSVMADHDLQICGPTIYRK